MLSSSCVGNADAHIGRIIGYCSGSSTCAIENTVSMATATFSGGDVGSSKLYLGGIAGSTDYWYTSYTAIKSCSYTSYVGYSKANGTGVLTEHSVQPSLKGSSALSLRSLSSCSASNGLN